METAKKPELDNDRRASLAQRAGGILMAGIITIGVGDVSLTLLTGGEAFMPITTSILETVSA